MKISTTTITNQNQTNSKKQNETYKPRVNDLNLRPVNKDKKAFFNQNNLTIKSIGKSLRNFTNYNPQVHRFSEAFYESVEQKKRPRLVKKNGELNIDMENVPKRKRRLLRDLFNTILGNFVF